MDYDQDLMADVVAFLEDMEDEIKAALVAGTEFDDIDDGDIRYYFERGYTGWRSIDDLILIW